MLSACWAMRYSSGRDVVWSVRGSEREMGNSDFKVQTTTGDAWATAMRRCGLLG